MKIKVVLSIAILVMFVSPLAGQSPATVQMLIGNLSDADPSIRTQAAHNLAKLGADAAPALPALIVVLKDKEPDVRYEAVAAIEQTGSSTAAINALVSEIDDPSKDVRDKAIIALGDIGEAAIGATDRLFACLISPDPDLVSHAGEALQNIHPPARTAMPLAMRLLRDGDFIHQVAALNIASGVQGGAGANDDDKSGPRTFDLLIDLLKSPSALFREKVLIALETIPLPDAATHQQLDAIEAMLHDPDEDVRQAAVKVFAMTLNEDRRLVVLPELDDLDVDVRLAALDVVGKSMRSIPYLIELLNDPSFKVRSAALPFLDAATIGRDEICPAVIRAASDRFSDVREAAATSLSYCSTRESTDALAKISSDPIPGVRVVALKSIAKMLQGRWQIEQYDIDESSSLFRVAVRGLNDGEDDVRTMAASTLQSIAPIPIQYLAAIAAHLSDPSKDLRRVAARIVGTYGSAASKFTPQLRELLQDNDGDVRLAAVESLGLVGATDSETVNKLTELLKSGDGDFLNDDGSLRKAILLTFGRLGSSSRPAMDTVIDVVMQTPGDYDLVDAGMRSLREMAPDPEKALELIYSKTPAAAPVGERVTLANIGTIYQPSVRKLIDSYNDEVKSATLNVSGPKGDAEVIPAGGRNVVIAIGTWCPHSRRLIAFLSNPQIRDLMSGWKFTFVLFDESPEINAIGGKINSVVDIDLEKYPSPVPLYDQSFLSKLPGQYRFWSQPRSNQISLPSVYYPAKLAFEGSAFELIHTELDIPNWIETSIKY